VRPFESDAGPIFVQAASAHGGGPELAAFNIHTILVQSYGFSTEQAVEAAILLIKNPDESSAHRKKLQGHWARNDQRGFMGMGHYSSSVSEFTFCEDYKYSHYASTTKSYSSPQLLTGHAGVMISPTLTETRDSGIYMVVAKADVTSVWMCSEKCGSSRVLTFRFTGFGLLSLGIGEQRFHLRRCRLAVHGETLIVVSIAPVGDERTHASQ
jgi:hypothetical protein